MDTLSVLVTQIVEKSLFLTTHPIVKQYPFLTAICGLVSVIILYQLFYKIIVVKRVDPQGKAVLVTGAASGIGKEITTLLLKNGAYVFAVDLNADQLNATWKNISNVTCIVCDVTKQDQVDNCKRIVNQSGKTLYGLVNNAGIPGPNAPLSMISSKLLELVFQINVIACNRFVQAFQKDLVQTSGCCVNVSSFAALGAFPFMGPYCSSKVALEYLSSCWRREFQACLPDVSDPLKTPPRFCCINPWFTNTNIFQASKDLTKDVSFGTNSVVQSRINRALNNSSKLQMITVSEVAQTALTALFTTPGKANYFVGPKSKTWTLPYMFPFLPKWITDWILVSSQSGHKEKLLKELKGR